MLSLALLISDDIPRGVKVHIPGRKLTHDDRFGDGPDKLHQRVKHAKNSIMKQHLPEAYENDVGLNCEPWKQLFMLQMKDAPKEDLVHTRQLALDLGASNAEELFPQEFGSAGSLHDLTKLPPSDQMRAFLASKELFASLLSDTMCKFSSTYSLEFQYLSLSKPNRLSHTCLLFMCIAFLAPVARRTDLELTATLTTEKLKRNKRFPSIRSLATEDKFSDLTGRLLHSVEMCGALSSETADNNLSNDTNGWTKLYHNVFDGDMLPTVKLPANPSTRTPRGSAITPWLFSAPPQIARLFSFFFYPASEVMLDKLLPFVASIPIVPPLRFLVLDAANRKQHHHQAQQQRQSPAFAKRKRSKRFKEFQYR